MATCDRIRVRSIAAALLAAGAACALAPGCIASDGGFCLRHTDCGSGQICSMGHCTLDISPASGDGSVSEGSTVDVSSEQAPEAAPDGGADRAEAEAGDGEAGEAEAGEGGEGGDGEAGADVADGDASAGEAGEGGGGGDGDAAGDGAEADAFEIGEASSAEAADVVAEAQAAAEAGLEADVVAEAPDGGAESGDAPTG